MHSACIVIAYFREKKENISKCNLLFFFNMLSVKDSVIEIVTTLN